MGGPEGWRKLGGQGRPHDPRGRRLDGDDVEETEEVPIEEAEGDEVAYLLDDSEYDEEKLKQMTQEELDEFLGELATHPHKSYPDYMLVEEERRLESMTESRLKSVLEQT